MEDDLRCSVQTRGLGEQLAGSATAAVRFVLVELPLPWPAKIEAHPVLVAATEQAGSVVPSHTRVLAIRPPNREVSERPTIISYRRLRPDAGFTTFAGRETTVNPEQLQATLAAVLGGDESALESSSTGNDVVLCAHGTRDRCCGSMGSLLALELSTIEIDSMRVWRASHTGGHRFAPTAITFPDGLTWGYVDAPLITSILDRTADPTDLHRHLRGCAGIDGRPAQVADAALFAHHGWAWLDHPRTAVVAENEQTQVEFATALGHATVTLRATDPVPVPKCAEALTGDEKLAAQFIVDSVDPG